MGLQKYHEKRKFHVTPEPRGRKRKSKTKDKGHALQFVIQEHHASHLHYDFRLEMEGVLRSWAVPKGPSLDPSVKRLAVEVEDHPLEYGKFEGVIPEDQYGAGHVILWDKGTWIPSGDPVAALKKGHLEFELKGSKLQGRWHLVRTWKGGRQRQWLLMKSHDDVEISPSKKKKVDVLSAHDKMPGKTLPQLARLVDTPPKGEGWTHEIKFDGYRVLTHIRGKKVQLLTRSGLDWTSKFESVRKAIEKLSLKNTILDGEIVVFDKNGHSDFQLLQNALSEDHQERLHYCIFDMPFLNGNDLTQWPLEKRRTHLEALLKKSDPIIRFSASLEGNGTAFFKEACDLRLEGIISKKTDSPYTSGRSDDWVKVKCKNRQEFVIGGYTDSTRPHDAFGALLLGVQEKDGLRYVGKTGTGFTAASMKEILTQLRKLDHDKPPFKNPPRERGVHWVHPKLVAEVNFASWTGGKNVRQASFQGLREDKPATQVIKETPAKQKNGKNKKPSVDVTLSNPQKVLFPKAKVTKQELADYYKTIHKWILPHLLDRPLTIVRCPNGTKGPCFYQRHPTVKSSHIRETRIGKEHGGKDDRNYVSLSDLQGVIEMVQAGTLEFHVWNTSVSDPGHPHEIVFDLDPGPGVDRKAIYECAIELKKVLTRLKLKSFVKLSGSKGLHIHVPIAPIYAWEDVKSFSHSIAKVMMERFPDKYTDNARKSERKKRIFIDYLRNGFSSTSVVPYGVRAKPEATVAMPIAWSELKADFDPQAYDVRSAIKRLRGLKRDPWSGSRKLKQKIGVL